MADPRNITDFSEINVNYATIEYDSSIVFDAGKPGGSVSAKSNLAVSIKANRKVGLATDGEAIHGELVQVEKTVALVKTGGYLSLKAGDGATLTLGKKIVGALGVGAAPGYIRDANTATAAELGKANGEVFDKADLAAVLVYKQ